MTFRVGGLLRYPVKSMLGEALPSADVDERGLAGDRRFALVEQATGLVASAKQPSKWGALLQCRASLAHDGGVEIVLPDGSTTSSDDPDVDVILSDFVGRDVSLSSSPPADPHLERLWPQVAGLAPPEVVREGPHVTAMASAAQGTFFDYAPIHLVTTSTLAALRAAGTADFDAARFRPNLILDAPEEGFAEGAWQGRRLRLGDVVLEVINHTPRCAVPALAHGALPRRPDVLRTVVAENRIPVNGGRFACVGVYARVVRGGSLGVGQDGGFAA